MKISEDQLHLLHIRDAIAKIGVYTKGMSFPKFAESDVEFDAIMMQFVVIGEAVNQLSSEFKEKHHTLPWHEAVGLRNQIAHGYFNVEPKIVWQTVKEDLPKLKKQLAKITKSWK